MSRYMTACRVQTCRNLPRSATRTNFGCKINKSIVVRQGNVFLRILYTSWYNTSRRLTYLFDSIDINQQISLAQFYLVFVSLSVRQGLLSTNQNQDRHSLPSEHLVSSVMHKIDTMI